MADDRAAQERDLVSLEAAMSEPLNPLNNTSSANLMILPTSRPGSAGDNATTQHRDSDPSPSSSVFYHHSGHGGGISEQVGLSGVGETHYNQALLERDRLNNKHNNNNNNNNFQQGQWQKVYHPLNTGEGGGGVGSENRTERERLNQQLVDDLDFKAGEVSALKELLEQEQLKVMRLIPHIPSYPSPTLSLSLSLCIYIKKHLV